MIIRFVIAGVILITSTSQAQDINFVIQSTYIDNHRHKYPGAKPPAATPLSYKNVVSRDHYPASPTPISYMYSRHGSIPMLSANDYLTCTEMISGVSFKISNGDSVTLLGVDLPTRNTFNYPDQDLQYQMMQFTSGTLAGRKFKLEYDNGARDLQGRLLAYVVFSDGSCLNEKVISAGFGRAHKQFPYELMDRYKYLESLAQKNGTGLWKFAKDN